VPPEHAPLLRAALILLADHEFNASACRPRRALDRRQPLRRHHGGLAALVAHAMAGHAPGRRPFDDLRGRIDAERPEGARPYLYPASATLYPDGDIRAAPCCMLREPCPTARACLWQSCRRRERLIDRKPMSISPP
jgi:citrate synthase